MPPYEKLGAFYLGRLYDPVAKEPTGGLVLYDSKDLTTHAVVLGMTGSGKTGLSIALLEEAAIDGVPAIAIDPKGDLGNLLLTFPDLSAESFEPWIDPVVAEREGKTTSELAAATARQWRDGLLMWEQEPERIQRLRDAVDISLYTPGSTSGMPLRLLRSFVPPPAEILADSDLFQDRVTGVVSGLLSLLGIDADPVQSREHILLSNLLSHAWRQGVDMSLPDLIRQVQAPPFEKVGVLDLESIFPMKDRLQLAIAINNLIAAPSFSVWAQGEPLEIGRLLSTGEGKPRISVLSIAHLSDQERMFFVTLLLNELVAWMRTQPGTSSLRAILYMDEIFGFFPPTRNPPAKQPMLTLLKQARAYGIGVVLATQNPVDLDYKGLSNAGTWFLGRLQTEQDRARVLDGLQSASGGGLDRSAMERLLAGLGKRCFVMQNAHEDGPVLFQTRWVMSYLRGPLTRAEIERLRESQEAVRRPRYDRSSPSYEGAPHLEDVVPGARLASAEESSQTTVAPILPEGIKTAYLPATAPPPPEGFTYRPLLVARARLHYIRATDQIDHWQERRLLASVAPQQPWETSQGLNLSIEDLGTGPDAGARYDSLPAAALRPESWTAWKKQLESYLYRTATLDLFRCSDPKGCSRPGESEGEFRVRLAQTIREDRDARVEKLRARFQPRIERLRQRLETAQGRAQREKEEYEQQKYQTAVSVGATVLGALFGRRAVSTGNVGRAATAARGVGRIDRERRQVSRAAAEQERIAESLENLERTFQNEVELMDSGTPPNELELEHAPLKTRKADIQIDQLGVLWTPWTVGADGAPAPAFDVKLLK